MNIITLQDEKTFSVSVAHLILTEMAEEEKKLDADDDFFTSKMSFDLDDEVELKRKKRRKRGGKPRPLPVQFGTTKSKGKKEKLTRLNHDEIPTQGNEINICPGCGSNVNEGEYVDTLISFVTGANDYLSGDSVRTQTIQSLKQQAEALDLPEPYEDWLLEVCARIESIIHSERDEMKKKMEEDMRGMIGELYEHIQDEVAAKIRQEVETEMWEQFEEMYRERNDQVE